MRMVFQSFRTRIGIGLLALAFALAGCGGGGETSDPDAVTPNAQVTIVQQPLDQTTVVGGTATFSITAQGNTVAYQWQRSADVGATWVDVTGATAATLTLPAVDLPMNGLSYRVIVSTGSNAVTSSAVVLTVATLIEAPRIQVDPVTQTVFAGSDALFTVTAGGTAVTYRWQSSANGQSWVDLAGESGATLRLAAVALSDSGRSVRAVVSNSAGSVVSGVAGLIVKPLPTAPAITSQPISASVTAPQSATFTVVAAASPAPTFQWQSSSDGGTTYSNLPSATSASYSTGSTSISMNSTLYRVQVSNSAGSVVSATALLSVSSAEQAPSITTQPQSATVTAPTTASFSVAASGNPTPSYQWQQSSDGGATFANVNGATSPTYITPTTATADTGKQFRAVVSNLKGSQTSGTATLTVNPPASNLQGRSWTTGQPIESGDGYVSNSATQMDDAGNATVVFLKDNGSRLALVATRGTPGAAGQAPTWSTPVAIDLLNGAPVNNMTTNNYTFDIAVAPNGNAVVYWFNTAACTGSTYQTSGSCRYLYTARYLAGPGAWEAPQLVSDIPSTSVTATINNNGDVVLRIPGWQRSGSNSYTARAAVAWRANSSAGYSGTVFTDTSLGATSIGLDGAGNMMLAAEANQNSTVDIVVYLGSLANGFGAQTILDTRGAAATLVATSVGMGGQAIVLWSQNNGSSTTMFAASRVTAQDAFVVDDLKVAPPSSKYWVVISDTGSAYYFDMYAGIRYHWAGGDWDSVVSLPDFGFTSIDLVSPNRSGDFVGVAGDNNFWGEAGLWVTYDAVRNEFVQAPSTASPGGGYVLGLTTQGRGGGYNSLSLSQSGNAILTLRNQFDVLPTPAAPSGDGRNVTNLWGLMLK